MLKEYKYDGMVAFKLADGSIKLLRFGDAVIAENDNDAIKKFKERILKELLSSDDMRKQYNPRFVRLFPKYLKAGVYVGQ